jgi:hypothetical protein
VKASSPASPLIREKSVCLVLLPNVCRAAGAAASR